MSVLMRMPLNKPAMAELELRPETLRCKIQKLWRAEPQVGDPLFDGAFYIVSTAPSESIRCLISKEVRKKLLKFLHSRKSWFLVHISDQTLDFEEMGGPKRPHGYPELIEALDELATALETHLPIYADGRFLMELISCQEGLPEGASCQVCGAPLGRARIECRACNTPHHPDCWEYNNGCSTFGCGGKVGRRSSIPE